MLVLVLGTLFVAFFGAMYRLVPLSAGETAASKRRLIESLFRLGVIFAIAYHLSYFFLIGFRSWYTTVPMVTGAMVTLGLVLTIRASPDSDLYTAERSNSASTLYTWSVLITFFFLPFAYVFAGA